MNKFIYYIKKYYSLIAFLIIIATYLVFCTFYALGFRFMIPNGQVMPDYEAINSVSSWVLPTLLSLVAICISIEVANRQNKIALFEKRYEVWTQYEEIIRFYSKLSNEPAEDLLECNFLLKSMILSNEPTINIDNEDEMIDDIYEKGIYLVIRKYRLLERQTDLLFGINVSMEINDVIAFLENIDDLSEIQIFQKKFCNNINKYNDNLQKMTKELKL